MKPRYTFKVPVDAECITCDSFSEKPLEEVKALLIWEGNKQRRLDELFSVEDDGGSRADETTIKISGDLSKVKRIGCGMTHGNIIVEGSTGSHLGGNMKGGSITVSGNVGSWLGSSMKGGRIEVSGDAGDYVAAPYRGSTEGMKGGEIIIHGNVGKEAGCFMKNGLIRIGGNASQFLGIHMRDGTVLVQGNAESRIGTEMLDGKIIVCGHIPEILPTFTIEDVKPNVKVDSDKINGPFYRFVGDLTANGEGKIYVSKPNNPHLNFYEEYI